jgi:hypothetical protein
MVARNRAHYDEVNIFGGDTGIIECLLPSFSEQIRWLAMIFEPTTLFNTCALHDPFVGSFDESREVVVIYSALWNSVA